MLQILILDTETTGFPRDRGTPIHHQPGIVEFCYSLRKFDGLEFTNETENWVMKPHCDISEGAMKCHGITNDMVKDKKPFSKYISKIYPMIQKSDLIVGHNIKFDLNMLWIEMKRHGKSINVADLKLKSVCTMLLGTNMCKIRSKKMNAKGKPSYKYPKLTELHKYLFPLFQFNEKDAHRADADVKATEQCFFEMVKRSVVPGHPNMHGDAIGKFIEGFDPESYLHFNNHTTGQ